MELCSAVFPAISFHKIPKFCFTMEGGNLFSRTGYTGEEGFEIYTPWSKAPELWNQFLKEGGHFSIGPVGLGARDTLRLEMGYLLSGQDFDETKSPLQAGLLWLIKSDENYIGREAILRQKAEGGYSRLKGFILEESLAVPRRGCHLYSKTGELLGAVTSGAKSPSLNKMIGMAYLKGEEDVGYLDVRGTLAKARIAPTPFLKKSGKSI